ncbi:MAG: VOC family protein [Myxococcota bacterium]
MPLALRRVLLFVKDLEAQERFYREVLGLEPQDGPETSPDFVCLQADGMELALHRVPEAIADTLDIATPPEPRSGTPLKLIFSVEDVAATCARLSARGVRLGELQRFGALEFCDALDLEGNVFQISSRP